MLDWADEIERAYKLIHFAFTIKGIDKAYLYCITAYALETTQNYNIALKQLKEAKRYSYNNYYIDFIKEEENRIKKKLNSDKPKAKKKKSSTKKRKKKNK